MKRAILPAVTAWIVGVACLMVVGYATRPMGYRTSQPTQEFFQGLMFYGWAVGIVVFPTCLLVITPLLRFLPRSLPLWQPVPAVLVGAMVAPFAMYLWAACYLRHAFAPDLRDQAHLIFGGTAVLVGAIFAFLYTASVRASIPPNLN